MKEIIIKTQAELDSLPTVFKELTQIQIKSPKEFCLYVKERYENGHVVAMGSSHVEAWESSHVVARESSHVEAWGSSHVVAWESSHVVAMGSSHVEAWESSHVVARESSHVEAWESVSITCQSEFSDLILFGFAVAILIRKANSCLKKSKTCTIVNPCSPIGNYGWLEAQGIEAKKGMTTLFKRISKDYKTQE